MNRLIFFILFSFSLFGNAFGQKKKVLLLGTAHFFNKGDDSITSPQKQIELKEIILLLEKFRPQQILVENPQENDILFKRIQIDYQRGILPSNRDKWLLDNEIFQIGIKLSTKLNLTNGVQGIDWADPAPDDTTSFKTNREKQYYDFVQTTRNNALTYETKDTSYISYINNISQKYKRYYKLQSNISLKKLFLTLNSNDALEDLYVSNRLIHLFLNHQGLGAELSSILTFRDYKIFRNALNTITPNTERVLIIYGAAHIQILKDLFSLDKRYRVIDVKEVIK
jgi:hypothetical protein